MNGCNSSCAQAPPPTHPPPGNHRPGPPRPAAAPCGCVGPPPRAPGGCCGGGWGRGRAGGGRRGGRGGVTWRWRSGTAAWISAWRSSVARKDRLQVARSWPGRPTAARQLGWWRAYSVVRGWSESGDGSDIRRWQVHSVTTRQSVMAHLLVMARRVGDDCLGEFRGRCRDAAIRHAPARHAVESAMTVLVTVIADSVVGAGNPSCTRSPRTLAMQVVSLWRCARLDRQFGHMVIPLNGQTVKWSNSKPVKRSNGQTVIGQTNRQAVKRLNVQRSSSQAVKQSNGKIIASVVKSQLRIRC